MDLNELWDLVRRIPPGRCTSYGALGSALPHPTTGRMVGRWMAQCPQEIPWWRVVNKKGELPVWKRDPTLADMQQQRLAEEGVLFIDDKADLAHFGWEPD